MYTQNHGKNAGSDAGVPVPPPDYGGNLSFSAAPHEEERNRSFSPAPREEERTPSFSAPISEEKKPEITTAEKEKPRETAEKPVSVLPRFWDNVSAEDLLLLGAVLFLLFSGRSESLLMPLVLVAAVLL